MANGGELYDYIPALNASDVHMPTCSPISSHGTRRAGRRETAVRGRLGRVAATRVAPGCRALARVDACSALPRPVSRNQHRHAGHSRIARVLRVARLRAGGRRRDLVASLCGRDRRTPVHRPARRATCRSPALTFVLPDLQLGVDRLRSAASTFEQERFGERRVQSSAACATRPDCVSRCSKRARSRRRSSIRGSSRPAATSASSACRCGTRTPPRVFWESLGFRRTRTKKLQPFPRTPLTSDGLESGAVSHACIAPAGAHVRRQRNARAADAPARRAACMCPMKCRTLWTNRQRRADAPEGTRLLLMTATRTEAKIATYDLPTAVAATVH